MPALLLPSRETLHAALLERDARYEGVFYAAVRTTGIFCRLQWRGNRPGQFTRILQVPFDVLDHAAVALRYAPRQRAISVWAPLMAENESERPDLPGLLIKIRKRRSDLIERRAVVLAAPAQPEALGVLATAIAQPIPSDLNALLRIHDGECGPLGLLTDESRLMSAREISSVYLSWLSYAEDEHENEAHLADPEVQPVKVHRSRIPFLHWRKGVCFVDMGPPASGTRGQVLFVEPVDGVVQVIARDLATFLERVLSRL